MIQSISYKKKGESEVITNQSADRIHCDIIKQQLVKVALAILDKIDRSSCFVWSVC